MIAFINSPAFKAANFPFSQAVRAGGLIHVSGNIGNIPGTMTMAPGGIAAEAKQLMENVGAALAEAGSGFDKLVKCTVYLADMAEWAEFNKVYVTYFAPGRFPARTAIGAHQLIANARVEMECVAAD